MRGVELVPAGLVLLQGEEGIEGDLRQRTDGSDGSVCVETDRRDRGPLWDSSLVVGRLRVHGGFIRLSR